MRQRKIDGKVVEKYTSNPFMAHAAEVMKKGWKPVYMKPEEGTGILTSDGEVKGAMLVFTKPIDSTGFLQVYAEGIGAILGLKSPGRTVFLLIYESLYGKQGMEKTEIILNYSLLPERFKGKTSERTFSRGINECIKAGIIAQSVAIGLYYVNPAYIFNGNRFNIINQYIKKEEQSMIDAQKQSDQSDTD
jgi:hypothetical protein